LSWFYIAFGATAVILSRGIITEVIRFFYNRPRPFLALSFVPLLNENSGSFPSGHASFFFALAPLAFLINKKAGYWFLVSSFSMVFARVAAGVHWPSDILGGIAIGLASFWIVKFALPKFNIESNEGAERIL
jgi:undecaprenyl-diphosphatase